MSKMLTVGLGGGLGNLMWQVAAGETIASECGRSVCFPSSTPSSSHHTVNYFETILRNHKHPSLPEAVPTITIKEPSYARRSWVVLANIPSAFLVTLEGYFQNYEYIPTGFGTSLCLQHIEQPSNVAFLHLRGGDYVNHWLHDVGVTHGDGSYYRTAMALFPPDTVFHVFTNVRGWAEGLPWLKELPIVWDSRGTPEEDLAAMAACPRGGICPNSTFSWWGAWLGHERWTNALYTLPKKWFNTPSIYVEGYFFPGAIII